MNKQILQIGNTFESELPAERARLVRLCASITGDAASAEDLAQEVLLEAWGHLNTLRDPEKHTQWLNGIARNVCLRWFRRQGRDIVRHAASLHLEGEERETDLNNFLADDSDLEVMLERKELIELLDRALALLPSETRTVMIQRYVEETPLSEVAARLGTQPGAVAMRLQRGKLALRRLLHKDMELHEGLERPEWEETRLWCVLCGQQHLLGQIDPQEGLVRMKCPVCCAHPDAVLTASRLPQVLRGIKGYKPALKRLMKWAYVFYTEGLTYGNTVCTRCGKKSPVSIKMPESARDWLTDRYGLYAPINASCSYCSVDNWITLDGHALSSPQGLHFWNAHPRMRLLPLREVEAEGRPALVITFESVKENASFSLLLDRETYIKLHAYSEGI